IKKISLVLIVIAILIAIILLVAKIVLQLKFNNIIEQTTLVTKNNQGYNSKVREINGKLNFMAKIQNDYIPWSNLVKKLAEITPADINFSYLKFDAQDKTISLKGKAKSRDSLLSFKDEMAANPVFQDIGFPIKNILEKENIDFEINAKLDLTKI
ncbi:PilN domain-containing protein, partial [Candidatus Falkowbacteria bacterium]|nr:PilN domain-containing protein [Candidatus Falkowbacteria bacterium]